MSSITTKLIFLKTSLISFLGFSFLLGLTSCVNRPPQSKENQSQIEIIEPIVSVAALGQLTPNGEIRKLAAPVSGFGGTPRISKLLVKEGDLVTQGQVLAIFDNRSKILSDLSSSLAKYAMLEKNISLKNKEVSRYESLTLEGAVPLVLLDQKQQELVKFEGQRDQVLYEIRGLEADYIDSKLLSPINGKILRIHSQVGERPGINGVLEVGASHSMQALVEVYESDISRVKIGQTVTLISENGGFKDTLIGNVIRISPQVRQRKVLSTDPTGDADARVVEVQVKLSPESIEVVKHLTGIKVIARFQP
tara:strand:+ start:3029 stop:3949 length:921 start_codon:yes stop_codon:yes gene_type:complete